MGTGIKRSIKVHKEKGDTGYFMVSFDTATTHTGFAVWRNGFLFDSGVIDVSKIKDPVQKITEMYININILLNIVRPGTVIIEKTSVPRNAKTQRDLTKILGGIHFWCGIHKVEYVEYIPTRWRRLITDKIPPKREPKGRDAWKKWSRDLVKKVWEKDVTDDESDAILIGQARIYEMEDIIKEKEKENDE